MSKRFRALLLEHAPTLGEDTPVALEKTLLAWQGKTQPQTDDILVIGFKA
jgi:hypothetical protein